MLSKHRYRRRPKEVLKGAEDEKEVEQTLLMRSQGAARHSWDQPMGGLVAVRRARARSRQNPLRSWAINVLFCSKQDSSSLRRTPVTPAPRKQTQRCLESSDSDLDPISHPPCGDLQFIYFHLQRRCLRQFNFQLPKYRDPFGPFLKSLTVCSLGGACIPFHLAFCT